MTWTSDVIQKAKQKQKTFREMLEAFDKAYWVNNSPEIDDVSYNKLKAEYLFLYEDDLPLGDIKGTVSLIRPMLSINNVFDRNGYSAWSTRVQDASQVLEPKIDGLACRLFYRPVEGEPTVLEFFQATTRGDGKNGEDVTDAFLRCVTGYPATLPVAELCLEDVEHVHLDGEVYVPITDLVAPYKGCRQQACAILRSGTTRQNTRPAHFILYGVCPDMENTFKSEKAMCEIMALYCAVVPLVENRVYTTPKSLWTTYQAPKTRKWALDKGYPIDGFVAKVNDFALRRELGETHRYVRGAIALKTTHEPTHTVAKDLTWGLAMSGRLVPNLHVEPVIINGSSVTKACLHTFRYFRDYHFAEGDPVGLVLAGDIVPDVTDIRDPDEVAARKDTPLWKYPEKCPGCGGTQLSEINHDLYCASLDACSGTDIARLRRGVSRDGLDLKGFGAKILEWCQAMGITALYQIFERFTHDKRLELRGAYMDHFGREGHQVIIKLLENVAEKKASIQNGEFPFSQVIFALCIPGLGPKASQTLAHLCPTIEDLVKCFGGVNYPATPEITDVTSQNLHNYFLNPVHMQNTLGLMYALTKG